MAAAGAALRRAAGARLAVVHGDLEAARDQAERKAAAHKTFTPQELAERFPLRRLTLEQREVLLLHFKPRTAAPGERIFRAGDDADGVYFIAQGEVEVAVAGRQITLGAGEVFGEMALISSQPRSADVTALDYSEFAVLSGRDFRHLLRKYPDIRAQIVRSAAEREELDRQLLAEGRHRRRRGPHERGEQRPRALELREYNTVRFGIPSVCAVRPLRGSSVFGRASTLPIPPATAQQHDVPMPSSLNFAVCSSSILAEALCLFSPFRANLVQRGVSHRSVLLFL